MIIYEFIRFARVMILAYFQRRYAVGWAPIDEF